MQLDPRPESSSAFSHHPRVERSCPNSRQRLPYAGPGRVSDAAAGETSLHCDRAWVTTSPLRWRFVGSAEYGGCRGETSLHCDRAWVTTSPLRWRFVGSAEYGGCRRETSLHCDRAWVTTSPLRCRFAPIAARMRLLVQAAR